MTDIVERLRAPAPLHWEAKEAADTITALRAENERLNKSRNKWGQKYNKLLEKHRVTRAEMANQIQWVKDLADNLIAEEAKTSALRAENERLRAAITVAIRQHEEGNKGLAHRTLCEAVYGRQA